MNQSKTGKFIAVMRKEKGLTQAQLAEKLNITDRAVSKWETGKSMPDSSIMLELCGILGITVNELLSGERIEMNNYEEKVNETLIELKRKDENNIKRNTLITIVYSIIMFVGALVCGICDLAISKSLTWSLITLGAISFAWVISFPVILLGKKGVKVSLIALSIFVLPFIYLLSRLIKVSEVFSIGAVTAIITLVFLWETFILFTRYKNRKLLAMGLTIVAAIILSGIINIVLSRMLKIAVFDIWDLLEGIILMVVAFACFIGDYVSRTKVEKFGAGNG